MTARTVVAPREVVAWVIREGTERGKGRYLYSSDPHCQPGWSETSVVAERWKTGNTSDARSTAEWVRGRVVRIVRPEPRDWAKLTADHSAAIDLLDEARKDRDAWKARAEAAEAPAPARVLRDGEGGCEPLPTPPKPQPAAGLYALSEVGYVLTRRGCDLLDALARKP